jgi:hypothetical protein
MRAVKLAKAAAHAEKLRLQALAQRQARRAICGLVASVFAVGALAFGHVMAFLAVVPVLGPLWTTVLLLAFDLLVAVVLGTLAVLSKPGEIEAEAQRLKERALGQMRQDLTVAALVPALGLFTGSRLAARRAARRARFPAVAARACLKRVWRRS